IRRDRRRGMALRPAGATEDSPVITLRIYSLDGTSPGTLTVTPDGALHAHPEGAMLWLLLARPAGVSAAAWLYYLERTMPGRTVMERDDWAPRPPGHAALVVAWEGQPEATVYLDGDRLCVLPAPGEDERNVRTTLERQRRRHWSDAELYHALPELLRGSLK